MLDNHIEVGGCIHHLEDRQTREVASTFEFSVRAFQIPDVVEQLRRKGTNGSWAVLMFYTPLVSTETSDQCLNMQYAIQNGSVGLEWVLRGERNREDKERLIDFIKAQGHSVFETDLNEVNYLRVEDGDIGDPGIKIVTDLYQVSQDYKLGLIVSGFQYTPGPKNLGSYLA